MLELEELFWQEKYTKLAKNTDSLSDRLHSAERELALLRNRYAKATSKNQAPLIHELQTEVDTLEKQLTDTTDILTKRIHALQEQEKSLKTNIEQLTIQHNDVIKLRQEDLHKITSTELDITRLQNKYNTTLGLVANASREITRLNNIAPYSPSKVELTMRALMRALQRIDKDIENAPKEELRIIESDKDNAIHNLEQQIEVLTLKYNELTPLNNKYIKVIGLVHEAYRDIVRLNSNTPYRPGLVEATLIGLAKKLESIEDIKMGIK